MGKNILFYSPFELHSRDTESLMIAFQRQGHRVFSLSQANGLTIHSFLDKHGIETHSFVTRRKNGWIRHCQHLAFLIRYCIKRKVDIVYSHLEPANFIAAMAQYFIRAKVYICRHHADQYHLLGIDKDLSYKITYGLARQIIVFSESTKRFMVSHENVALKKVTKINLAYDFSLYPTIRQKQLDSIKDEMAADIVLITVGSLSGLKRPELSIEVLNALIIKGYDVKLIFLGTGVLEQKMKSRVKNYNLTDRIFFRGYVDNVLEYLSCASVLIHPSISEASCVVVKEAGLVKRPVIVCKGVGDFDDYIINGVNGFIVDGNDFVDQTTKRIEHIIQDKQQIEILGGNLHEKIINLFSIDNVISNYKVLNS